MKARRRGLSTFVIILILLLVVGIFGALVVLGPEIGITFDDVINGGLNGNTTSSQPTADSTATSDRVTTEAEFALTRTAVMERSTQAAGSVTRTSVAMVPTQTSTPTSTATVTIPATRTPPPPPAFVCDGALPAQLRPGDTGRVTLEGTANRMRSGPTLGASIVTTIPPGGEFFVLDGPVCAERYVWYQVNYQGQIGWTAESSDAIYWLEPIFATISGEEPDDEFPPGPSGETSPTPRLPDLPPTDETVTEPETITPTTAIIEVTPEPEEIAMLPVRVVDAAGGLLGDGTLRVFHADRVTHPETTRIELDLSFDNRYITPTPFGSVVTIVPVTPITPTPGPGAPEPTPRIPRETLIGVLIRERMGASLICLETRFEGCDGEIEPTTARPIGLNGARWTWIISPREDARGWQDLRVVIWTPQFVNNAPTASTIWEYPFRIEVLPERDDMSGLLAGLAGSGILGAGLLGGLIVSRRRRKRKPSVFISYRRRATWAVARTIHDHLTRMGAQVFIDVDDINEGRFEEIIKENIRQRDYFLLVLAPDTLESEWVVRETLYAIEHDKRMIPVLVNGFELTPEALPDGLKDITRHNAVTLTPEFFQAGLVRLAQFLGLTTPKKVGK